ncbi:hypothetical protein AWW66_03390 [Micromonospora rosaria]|uniref:Uncharacterized protein n=1 Tax=Micromonospora rosaria TaxID=47874 RepID=A0A136PY14_9ACTN|nr:hypothetical protein [Micromonospora rosaria]KXK63370.1 hypothetical protein AWW66_03390 [Micromonospora rosaria]
MTAVATRTRTRRTLDATTTVVHRDPTTCLCPGGKGVLVAAFQRERLVDVERRHLRTTGCGRGPEHVDVADFLATIPIGRR